jgi:hypothetical protein
MSKRRGCRVPVAVTLGVLAALACVVLSVFAVLYIRQQQTRAQFQPPSVTITYPASGTSTLEGSCLSVSATAFGGTPITRAELWVDGKLMDTQESRVPEGMSPFHVSFEVTVSQGLHTLFVRAVNALGIMGDSWPVNVAGAERPGPDDPARVVTVEQGETLDDIAAAYDADPETVRQLNPGLGDQEPAEGSEVELPPPQSKSAPSPDSPSVGPALPAGGIQPPEGGPVPPPTGPGRDSVGAPPPISTGPLSDLVTGGSPPAAPTELSAHAAGCDITMTWQDNADNEERFEVWYLLDFGQEPVLAGEREPWTPESDCWEAGWYGWNCSPVAWYTIPEVTQGSYIIWVEAVNSWGRQPSNRIGPVVVGTQCAQAPATQLQVEALDMTVPAAYDNVYCYMSFEGALAARVPGAAAGDEQEFIQVAGGRGDISSWASGDKKFVVAIPGDESLEIQGECAGWSGGEWSELGDCSGIYPRESWDGIRRPLPGSGFEIGVAIKPLQCGWWERARGTCGETTTRSHEDPVIPEPYDVRVVESRTPWAIDRLARGLAWKWDGDPNSISGFQILLDGVPYNAGGGWSLVDPAARWFEVTLPQECGGHVSWQVRAVSAQAQSGLSALTPENDYDLPPCPEPVYAMVTFNTVQFHYDCDDLDLYWFLEVNGVTKHFHDSCDPCAVGYCGLCRSTWYRIEDDCGPHSIGYMGRSVPINYPHTIVAYLGTTSSLKDSSGITIEVVEGFWDTLNRIGLDDNVSVHRVLYEFASLTQAQQALGCGREVCVGPGTPDPLAKEYVGYRATLCYTLYLFPQAQSLDCPFSEPWYTP